MDHWTIKQLLDVVSKGVNSVLMRENAPVKDLNKLAKGLTKIYLGIFDELNKPKVEPARPEQAPAWVKKALAQDKLDDEANKQFDAASEQENESV